MKESPPSLAAGGAEYRAVREAVALPSARKGRYSMGAPHEIR